MSLPTEAAYLYSYSKELRRVNKELHKLAKELEHHREKHAKTTNEDKRTKHKKKHTEATSDAKGLVRKHKHLLKQLEHHLLKFHEEMRKQHKRL